MPKNFYKWKSNNNDCLKKKKRIRKRKSSRHQPLLENKGALLVATKLSWRLSFPIIIPIFVIYLFFLVFLVTKQNYEWSGNIITKHSPFPRKPMWVWVVKAEEDQKALLSSFSILFPLYLYNFISSIHISMGLFSFLFFYFFYMKWFWMLLLLFLWWDPPLSLLFVNVNHPLNFLSLPELKEGSFF